MINKSELLLLIRNTQNEMNNKFQKLFDLVANFEETQPEQAIIINSQDKDSWLTVQEVCKVLKISDATFYKYLNEGLLPPGFEFGPRSKRWKLSDIEAWQSSKNIQPSVTKRRGRSSRIKKYHEFI